MYKLEEGVWESWGGGGRHPNKTKPEIIKWAWALSMGLRKEVFIIRKQFNDKAMIDFPAKLADNEKDASE